MKKSFSFYLSILTILFVVSVLKAEEPEKKTEKPYTSSTSFSLLITSGNTQELTFGFDTEQSNVTATSEALLGWSHDRNIGQDSAILSFMSLLVVSSVKVLLTPTSHISCQELFYNHKSLPGFKNMDHYFFSSLVLNL